MKGFISAVVLLLLVVLCIVINSIAVGQIFSDISELLRDLPSDVQTISTCDENQKALYSQKLEYICKEWGSKKKIIALSTPHDEADKFTTPIIEAKEYFKGKDYISYLAYLANAKEALKHLSDAERLNLDNIT
jgi:hypothetical protein